MVVCGLMVSPREGGSTSLQDIVAQKATESESHPRVSPLVFVVSLCYHDKLRIAGALAPTRNPHILPKEVSKAPDSYQEWFEDTWQSYSRNSASSWSRTSMMTLVAVRPTSATMICTSRATKNAPRASPNIMRDIESPAQGPRVYL